MVHREESHKPTQRLFRVLPLLTRCASLLEGDLRDENGRGLYIQRQLLLEHITREGDEVERRPYTHGLL